MKVESGNRSSEPTLVEKVVDHVPTRIILKKSQYMGITV